ncbi:MAG TPA: triose-phosphate isomerase [Chitinophagaceae bacterium]|nr:triose-phosphate isomerase [Chitinophagaceae bacterium]MCC6634100.1 triose-phosphate isomerase [Chitinophagaceae bacterium]HNJ59184.1 triose-phosphate isomerase [Chitinophagaceae bacterium]HNN31992.1 triose-phosphate isomerase [Chitinophagaceae bacterium]
MRKQIAAANWKMNCTLQQAEELLTKLSTATVNTTENKISIIGVPAPYLLLAKDKLKNKANFYIAAQNCYTKKSGAFTGEISAEMLHSMQITHVIIGHSERREYFNESNTTLAEKVNIALEYALTPIFCCGEALEIREANNQNSFVENQLKESLFHLSVEQILQVVIAYEPIWAIGTGKTASNEQAQEMHQHIRNVLANKYGKEIAEQISILYGGSVKGSNAADLFAQNDVDGGLVGGASLNAEEFTTIINAL